ncbi:MAG: hypothetical protein KDA57_10460 [Planctomycetales bacterium]|nr:hypothetical protein [Planctomycetales bacterium]
MGEFDFRDNLIVLAVFHDPTAAASALRRLERAGISACLSEDSSDVNDLSLPAELIVRQGDLRHARELLAGMLDSEEESDEEHGDPDQQYHLDYDADDWAGEARADNPGEDEEEDDFEPYSEEPSELPPLSRAWRAACIGGLMLPCLVLNLYSVWLIAEHKLWRPRPGEKHVNWRFPAAIILNLVGVAFFCLIVFWQG